MHKSCSVQIRLFDNRRAFLRERQTTYQMKLKSIRLCKIAILYCDKNTRESPDLSSIRCGTLNQHNKTVQHKENRFKNKTILIHTSMIIVIQRKMLYIQKTMAWFVFMCAHILQQTFAHPSREIEIKELSFQFVSIHNSNQWFIFLCLLLAPNTRPLFTASTILMFSGRSKVAVFSWPKRICSRQFMPFGCTLADFNVTIKLFTSN